MPPVIELGRFLEGEVKEIMSGRIPEQNLPLLKRLAREGLEGQLPRFGQYDEATHKNDWAFEIMESLLADADGSQIAIGDPRAEMIHGGRVEAGIIPVVNTIDKTTLVEIVIDPAILGVTWRVGPDNPLVTIYPELDLDRIPEEAGGETSRADQFYVDPAVLADKSLRLFPFDVNEIVISLRRHWRKTMQISTHPGASYGRSEDDRYASILVIGNNDDNSQVVALGISNKLNQRLVASAATTDFGRLVKRM